MDTQQDPLASYSGIFSRILGGIHWQAALVGYSAGRAGIQQDNWRDPLAGSLVGSSAGSLAGYSAGSTGRPLWRDTRRDPLASSSGGILGGIHWPADTRIHWRAALAGYWVGAWCRSIANADSNIKSSNSFLLGGE